MGNNDLHDLDSSATTEDASTERGIVVEACEMLAAIERGYPHLSDAIRDGLADIFERLAEAEAEISADSRIADMWDRL